jgi:glutamine---fructose-6-phosphate transaminase (isomerizing)
MCGIVGYVGNDKALPVLIKGLKSLEYRGYDSAGIAIHTNGKVKQKRSLGKVAALEATLGDGREYGGSLGIAHTRWATHGVPSERNSHPHVDCKGRVFVVHNGIVENYKELKSYLIERGHAFSSDTDTEVVAHLVEDFLAGGRDFKSALFATLKMVRGAYALALIDANDPDTLYTARLSSPLVIGVGEKENFLASDPAALVGRTRDVIYLKDGEVAEVTKNAVSVSNLDQEKTPVEIVRLEWDLEQAQKGDYPHFMLKEIYEGPEVIRAAMRGRLDEQAGTIKLGGLEGVADRLAGIKRIIILACGTSYYAGLVGEYLLEEIAGLPVEVQFASEFRYREEPFEEGTVAIAVSQSGETADTLAAIRKAKEKGLLTLGIVNVVGSSIARETDAGVYNHAGPEIGVASTKAFLSQITVLALIAALLSKKDGKERAVLLVELPKIPAKVERILAQASNIEKIAEKYKGYRDFLFLGRRYGYPTAMEGALKLKEISYIHAEGYGAGEMKHGPLAMISGEFPTVAVVSDNDIAEKMHSNLEEIKARRGPIIAIAAEGDKMTASLADDVIHVPKTIEPLEPLLAVVPLQLFAYYIGVKLGFDVDKPRNLAKSVTVE